MSDTRRQWTLVGAIVVVLGAGVTLAARLRDQIVFVEPGSKAPQFEATTLTTDSVVTLDAYRGKVVLLNIWATWCAPCRQEMPSMERLHKKLEGTDFRVVAVSVRDNADAVKEFVQDVGITFDILFDPDGQTERRYQTTGVPESFVIDRRGIIMKREIGAREWDSPEHEAMIRRLLDVR